MAQDGQGGARERHGVRNRHLHALGRHRPGGGGKVDLGPQGPAGLTAAHRGENQELKGQAVRLPSIAGPHSGERGANLGMRQRGVMGVPVLENDQARKQRRSRRIVDTMAARNGPVEDGGELGTHNLTRARQRLKTLENAHNVVRADIGYEH